MIELVRRLSAGAKDPAAPPVKEILNPSTGALVPLDAGTDELAGLVDALEDLRNQAAEARASVERELLDRMDRRGKWTADVGGWRLESSSPNAGTVGYDGERLRRDLLQLVREGVIDREAVDEAVERVRPAPVLKVRKRGVDALRKLGGKVADAVRDAEIESAPPPRRVKVRRKGDA